MGVEQEPTRQEDLREAEKGLSEEEKAASIEVGAYEHAVELESTIWRLGETIKRLQEQFETLEAGVLHKAGLFNQESLHPGHSDRMLQSFRESEEAQKREAAINAKTKLEAELRAESSSADWQPAPAESSAESSAEAEEPTKE